MSAITAPAIIRMAAHPVRWRVLAALTMSDYRVRELVDRLGEPANLISYHVRLLRESGLVSATRSSFDKRESYYHLQLDRYAADLAAAGIALHPALALHHTLPPGPADSWSVLFVCTGNSVRSVFAAALTHQHSQGRITAVSAGTHPADEIHPDTVRVLRSDFGMELPPQPPRPLRTVSDRHFDAIITLCDKARESCPEFVGHPRWMHWSIPNPTLGDHQHRYHRFQATAAEINTRVRYFLPTLT